MKYEKGITLTALVGYVIVFTVIIAIMTTITNYLYRNIGAVKETPSFVAEYNKFCMFFIADVKNNSSIRTITDQTIEFEDGTVYEFKSNKMYRNDKLIARYINDVQFTGSQQVVNGVTKNIINVNMDMGTGRENLNRNTDFVLKYW